jgi:hypothetical protein
MRLTAIIEREGDGYVSLCPELDIASQGDSVEQARGDSSPPIKNLMAIRSGNYGRTFTRSVIAANVGALATDVGFGVGGAAHVVYEQADGDQFCCSSGIRYIYSQKAPYTS